MQGLTSYALKILGRRAYTTQELRKKLELFVQRKNCSDAEGVAAIHATLAKLSAWGYLDDPQFAEQFVRSRVALKPKSLRAIAYELQRKGISKDVAETATQKSGVDDRVSAQKVIARHEKNLEKLPEEKRRAKVYRLLATRGFSSNITAEIMRTFFD